MRAILELIVIRCRFFEAPSILCEQPSREFFCSTTEATQVSILHPRPGTGGFLSTLLGDALGALVSAPSTYKERKETILFRLFFDEPSERKILSSSEHWKMKMRLAGRYLPLEHMIFLKFLDLFQQHYCKD